jgi:hypothetical protein
VTPGSALPQQQQPVHNPRPALLSATSVATVNTHHAGPPPTPAQGLQNLFFADDLDFMGLQSQDLLQQDDPGLSHRPPTATGERRSLPTNMGSTSTGTGTNHQHHTGKRSAVEMQMQMPATSAAAAAMKKPNVNPYWNASL